MYRLRCDETFTLPKISIFQLIVHLVLNSITELLQPQQLFFEIFLFLLFFEVVFLKKVSSIKT